VAGRVEGREQMGMAGVGILRADLAATEIAQELRPRVAARWLGEGTPEVGDRRLGRTACSALSAAARNSSTRPASPAGVL
jgi:hypothetical protein